MKNHNFVNVFSPKKQDMRKNKHKLEQFHKKCQHFFTFKKKAFLLIIFLEKKSAH